jgi:hypothetical protein
MNILPLTVVPLMKLTIGLYNYVNFNGVNTKFVPPYRSSFESNRFIYTKHNLYGPLFINKPFLQQITIFPKTTK